MSHFPVNADEFIPSDRFAAVFGRQKWDDVMMWDDLKFALTKSFLQNEQHKIRDLSYKYVVKHKSAKLF